MVRTERSLHVNITHLSPLFSLLACITCTPSVHSQHVLSFILDKEGVRHSIHFHILGNNAVSLTSFLKPCIIICMIYSSGYSSIHTESPEAGGLTSSREQNDGSKPSCVLRANICTPTSFRCPGERY